MLTFEQFKEKTTISALPLREKFYRGLVFKVGQIVEDSNGVYEILDRGSNYVTVCDSSGELSRKFVNSLQESERPLYSMSGFGFKGYEPKHLSEDAKSAFARVFEAYEAGTITDAVAVLKSLRSVDSIFESFDIKLYDSAIASLTRIGVVEDHQYLKSFSKHLDEGMQIKPADKLKVASIIADTLGASSSGTNPEIIVNNALRVARKNQSLMNGESFKIIQRMLELARSVDIGFDENILKRVNESVSHSKSETFKKVSKIIESHVGTSRTHENELQKIRDRMTVESFSPGNPVKVTPEKGRVMYGIVHGIHGSVIAVKHGNHRVTYHHNHKVTKHTGPSGKADQKTFADIANLGKKQDVDNVPQEFNDMQASTMTHSDNTTRRMVANKLKGLS